MSRKWKILYTIPNFHTAGSGKALVNIARRLNKTRFVPHICCSHDRGIFFKEVIASGIPIHLHQTTLDMIPRMKGLLSCIKLARYFRSLKVDLIHSFHYGPDYSEPLAARLAGIPWVYTKKNMNWGGKSKNGWKLRTGFASYILAQNKDMMKDFFPGEKNISLVPRGVDTEEFTPRPKDRKLLEKYQIGKGERVIITVTNLVPIKGIEILLDAFEVLSNNHDSIRLIIVGDKENDYGRAMEEKALNSQFSENIHFTGKVQNVVEYYSIAGLFVFPSLERGEGSPVALLEAIASGLPVVASDVPGVRDILCKYPAYLFPAESTNNLFKKLNQWFESGNANNSSTELINFVKNKYNIEKEVQMHENIYDSILGFKN